MKLNKIIISVIVFISVMSPVSASTSNDEILEIPNIGLGENITIEVGDAKYIKGINGTIMDINDLMHFNTKEEADHYYTDLKNNPTTENDSQKIELFSTSNDVLVNRHTFWSSTVDLRLEYETSRDNNTGVISKLKPYTTHYGITIGQEWKQNSISATKTASGKDVYVFVSGECILYTFVSGTIEVYREPVRMGGTVFIIR